MQSRNRAALAAAAASLAVAAIPGAAHATATPMFANGTLTVRGDATDDTITLGAVGGQLALNGTAVAGANTDGPVGIGVHGPGGRGVGHAAAPPGAPDPPPTVPCGGGGGGGPR